MSVRYVLDTTRALVHLGACAERRLRAQLGMFMHIESCGGENGAQETGEVLTCVCKHCTTLACCDDTLLGTGCCDALDVFHKQVHEDSLATARNQAGEYYKELIMSTSKHNPTWHEYWSRVHQYESSLSVDAPRSLEEVANFWFSMGKSSTLFNSDLYRLQQGENTIAEENSMWMINHCLWAMGEKKVTWRASAEVKKYFRGRSY
jgi:hypothetical protein